MQYFESQVYHTFCQELFGFDTIPLGMVSLKEIRCILETIDKNNYRSMLDAGCGCGFWDNYLCCNINKPDLKILGVDIDSNSINYAIQNTAKCVNFQYGNIDDIASISQMNFDVILFFDTIYFCKDYMVTLDESLSLLNEGGCLIVLYSSFTKRDNNALLVWIEKNKLQSDTVDYSVEHLNFWKRKKALLVKYQMDFLKEGSFSLYRMMMNEYVDVDIDKVERKLYTIYKGETTI